MTLSSPRRQTIIQATDAAVQAEATPPTLPPLMRVALHLQAGRRQAAMEDLRLISPAEVFDAAQCQMIGSLFCNDGALQEALAWFDRACRLAPQDWRAAAGCATILFRLDRLDEALAAYDVALQYCRTDAKTFYNRGLVLRALGRQNEAIAALDEALKLDPADPEALRAGGLLLRDAERLEPALAFFVEALRLRPEFYECRLDHANLLQQLGRFADAVSAYDAALELFPGDPDLLNNRGAALRELGDLDAALECFDAALAARPAFAPALFNRGTLLLKMAPPEAALACYDAALALRPGYADAQVGRGVALKALCRFDEAEAAFDAAIALEPNSAHALNNKGALQLLRGDFARGLEGYEYRWISTGIYKRVLKFPIPEWRGETGKHVLVYDEQGFGDTFQFSRYLPLMADSGVKVTFFCRSPLVAFMRCIDPRVDVVDHFGPDAGFDAQIALSSLPRAFGTRLDSIPAPRAYLAADPQRVDAWRGRLGADGFKVGLCWQGNLSPVADPKRSIPLAAFAPLAGLPGVRLIGLQRGADAAAAQTAAFRVETIDDLDAGPDAFLDTAAVMECLDLVITCDTSSAHLAGGLGRPTFLLLKRVPDWRWLLDREDSPWYPTMRLFRQQTADDWASVMQRVAAAIGERQAAIR